jgi:NAD-dependent deacetylase
MNSSPGDFRPELVAALRNARSVAVLTGAGISAESGVPTFRDAQTGLWAKYEPQELATPEAFRQNPKLVWQWYEWRRHLVSKAEPNPGHLALVALEKRVPKFALITQNVDGLHQRAGSQRVIELHGNIARTKCFQEDTIVSFGSTRLYLWPLWKQRVRRLSPQKFFFQSVRRASSIPRRRCQPRRSKRARS